MWKLKMLKLKAKAGKWGGAWKDMIFEVRARLLLESSCKIVRIWIQALDLFESEQIWILAQNQLEGTLGRPFRLGAIFCHFLIWIKRPTSYPPLYNGDVGRGWLPLFWVFQREEEGGGGAVIRQCGEGLGQLSNSPVSGKSYIEGDATTPETEPATKNSNISHWRMIIFGDLNRKLLSLKKTVSPLIFLNTFLRPLKLSFKKMCQACV